MKLNSKLGGLNAGDEVSSAFESERIQRPKVGPSRELFNCFVLKVELNFTVSECLLSLVVINFILICFYFRVFVAVAGLIKMHGWNPALQ